MAERRKNSQLGGERTSVALTVARPTSKPQPHKTALDRSGPAERAADLVYARLHGDIIALTLPPGQLLDRSALQAEFNLSSTPVRDALLRLGTEGLVDIFPQSATRVSLIDVAKAREAQFLRRAIEIEAVKTVAVRADKALVTALRALITDQKIAAGHADLGGFDELDRAFHRRIIEAAGVADLFALVRRRSGHIDRIRRLHLPVIGKIDEVLRHHAAIAKAIATGDPTAAETQMRDHLSRTLAYSPALRAAHPTYFAQDG